MKKSVRIASLIVSAFMVLTALAGCGKSEGGDSTAIKIGSIGPPLKSLLRKSTRLTATSSLNLISRMTKATPRNQ